MDIFFYEMAIALMVGVVFTVVFYLLMWRIGSRRIFLTYFLIVTFAAWAGGKWLPLMGIHLLNIYWFSFFISGSVFALLLFLTEFYRRSWNGNPKSGEKVRTDQEGTFRFLWGLILAALILAVFLGYL